METQEFSDTFSLFRNLNTETLEWLLSMADRESYQSTDIIISEDDWGKGIYFIVSGWVKLDSISREEIITTEIIGRGGFVGEAGILGTIKHNARVSCISAVELLSISAQRFIQILYRDAQIQNRFLEIMVKRVTEYQKYCQFYRQTPKVRLATILISLADKYGKVKDKGIKLYNFKVKDLADLSQLTLDECSQVLEKLEHKNLIIRDSFSHSLFLTNIKQLHHIIGKLGNE